MSSDSSQEHKKFKIRDNESTETDDEITETSIDYDGEYGEEFVILSDDEMITDESSDSTYEEEDYFGESEAENSQQTEYAWEDSDDVSELREEIDNDAKWLEADGIQKVIKKSAKKISFKIFRKIFTAKCRVKLFKVFSDYMILVDSFNLIYFIKNFDDFKTYKIDFFKVTDLCFFNGKYLFYSEASSLIKQVTPEGKVVDIKKGTGNIKKIVPSQDKLFVLGDKIFLFNQNISLVNEFPGSYKDICITESALVALKDDGDICIFDKDLNFLSKISLTLKFSFKSLYGVDDKIFVCTADGLIILDSNFNQMKTTSNLSHPISCLVDNKDFVVHGAQHENSLRILRKHDFTYFEKFPFSKVKINSISAMAIKDDTVYFSDSKFITSLKLKYN